MAKTQKSKFILQPYPRRTGSYVADDNLFPQQNPLNNSNLQTAIRSAFERCLRNKKGNLVSPHLTPHVYDGKREGDVEAEIDTPIFKTGLRLYISVKKSSDTVGGQDIGGVFTRLETSAKQDKNLNRPYMGVVAIATPPKGVTYNYQNSRIVRCKDDEISPFSFQKQYEMKL